jgi:hypothetical protein
LSQLGAEETRMADWKKACKSVAKEQSQKKAHAGRGQEIKWEIPDQMGNFI